jgi:SOUL heme-binding protein
MTFDDAPAPTDGRVQLHRTADQLVAALRFSGRMSVENYETQMRRLQEYLTRDGYLPTDAARVARFNAPWTPGFMRRNEIQIPIEPVNK